MKNSSPKKDDGTPKGSVSVKKGSRRVIESDDEEEENIATPTTSDADKGSSNGDVLTTPKVCIWKIF